MRKEHLGFILIGLLWLAPLAATGTTPKESSNSIVITFKDGHQQSFQLADIARIEFKTPPEAAAAKSAANTAEQPGRRRFIGKWTVGDGRGHTFYFTFEENGQATNTVESGGHGTWNYVDGELHVSWDNGWHDAIRKVGSKYMKFAYPPGRPYTGNPDNVGDAEKTNPEPI